MPNNVNKTKLHLIRTVKNYFKDELNQGGTNNSQIRRVLSLMEALEPNSNKEKVKTLPGCIHLPRTIEMSQKSPAARIGSLIKDLSSEISWHQNPLYTEENKGKHFMDNYGWSDLGILSSKKMSFGVLLLGPDTVYPLTSYESEGIFIVIGGTPKWKSGNKPWVNVESGDMIYRPFGGAEGKKPGKEPMLALYTWLYR